MDIFSVFKKKNPVVLRCTECDDIVEITPKQVRLLKKRIGKNPICPIMHPCAICTGALIPVKYSDKKGNVYQYHDIKQKIANQYPDYREEILFFD